MDAENRARSYLRRAREVRQVATRLRYRDSKRVLLQIATLYCRLAQRNEHSDSDIK